MASVDPKRSRPQRMSAEEFHGLTGRKSPRRTKIPRRKWTQKLNAGPQEPFSLRLPFLPPSVNKLFTTVRDPQTGVIKRVLTQKARRIRRLIVALIDGVLNPNRLYELRLDVHLSAYTKKGKVRRVDLTNRVKFIEDCVCEALGIDDSHIFRVVLTKHDSDAEFTEIEINEIEAQKGREAA